jgi:hypothetical protein
MMSTKDIIDTLAGIEPGLRPGRDPRAPPAGARERAEELSLAVSSRSTPAIFRLPNVPPLRPS